MKKLTTLSLFLLQAGALLLILACAKSDESKTSETETSNSNTSVPSTASRTSDIPVGSKECL